MYYKSVTSGAYIRGVVQPLLTCLCGWSRSSESVVVVVVVGGGGYSNLEEVFHMRMNMC